MELDTDKIDQAALALLALGRHEGYRVWDGARESERLLQALFCRSPDRGSP